MQSKQIVITSPGATGDQTYTGVGFQGKLLIIHSVARANGDTHTGAGIHAGLAMGAAVSSSSMWALGGYSRDNQTAGDANAARSDTLCIRLYFTGANRNAASFVAWTSDGFTLNWSTVSATDSRQYICTVIGGNDVSVAIGYSNAGGSTGNQSVTGLSFQPNTLIFADNRLSSGAIPGTGAFFRPMMGFVDSAGNQGSWAGDSHDATTTSTTTSAQSTSAAIINSATAASDIDRRATFVSYNSDGFTLNFSTLDASVALSSKYMYIALNVPYSLVGVTDQRTSTGTTDITTTGFTPKFIALGGDGTTSTNGASQDERFSVGFAVGSGSGDQGTVTLHDKDAQADTDTSSAFTTGKILQWITANHGSPSTIVQAAISAISNGLFTINYDTVDATARKVIYLAMGDAVTSRVPQMGFINFQNPGIA